MGKNFFDTFVAGKRKGRSETPFPDMLGGSLRHVHSEHSVVTAGQRINVELP